MLGAGIHQQQLINSSFNTNHSFAGLYNLKQDSDYASLLTDWLDGCEHNSLIMCHPGDKGFRVGEFEVLSGSAFAEQLEQLDIQLVRGSGLFSRAQTGL